jgi:hypothetical protein
VKNEEPPHSLEGTQFSRRADRYRLIAFVNLFMSRREAISWDYSSHLRRGVIPSSRLGHHADRISVLPCDADFIANMQHNTSFKIRSILDV